MSYVKSLFYIFSGIRILFPLSRCVRPISVPFSEAPRIPHENQLFFFDHVDIYFYSCDQRIGVSIHQTNLGHIVARVLSYASLRRNGCCHDVTSWVSFLYNLPKAILLLMVRLMHIDIWWSSSQERESFSGCTGFDSVITAVNFSPNFFKYKNPNFFLIGSTESPLLLINIIWKGIINYDFSLLSINPHLDGIAPHFINLLCQKYVLNPLGMFSNRAETWQKVAVTTITLLDIVWFNIVKQRKVALTIDFTGSLPDKIGPIFNSFISPDHGV